MTTTSRDGRGRLHTPDRPGRGQDRQRDHEQLNPIARSWYLTGALELEGTVDPAQILQAFGALFAVDKPVPDIIKGWRYQLDADAAQDVDLVVGIRAADSGEERTVRIRHRVLHVADGIADDTEVVVEATAAQANGDGSPTVVSGDLGAWGKLQSLLDTEWTTFYMHMR